MNKPSYMKISKLLKTPSIKAEILFAVSSTKLFTRFTLSFQREEPFVHLLFDEIELLIKSLLGKVCKNVPINISEDVLDETNLLFSSDIFLPDDIQAEIQNISEKERQLFRRDARAHFVEASKHIIKKSSFVKPLLKSFQCLQPQKVKSEQSCLDVVELSKHLPLNIDTSRLYDEWHLLQIETDVPEDIGKMGIESFWHHFMTLKDSLGNTKYPTVGAVVKTALSVSHGNADVERGFSCSVRVLTDDRASLSERTLNAILTVKSVLKLYQNKPHLVPITKDLVASVRCAYMKYHQYIESEKQKKELEAQKIKEEEERKAKEKEHMATVEKKKKEILEGEKALETLRKEETMKRKTAATLLQEANERLRKALEKGDVARLREEAGLAQAMIEGVAKVEKEASAHKRKADDLQNSLQKKTKSVLMTDFFQKK